MFENWKDAEERMLWEYGVLILKKYNRRIITSLVNILGIACGIPIPREALEFVYGFPLDRLIPTWCSGSCVYEVPYVGKIKVARKKYCDAVDIYADAEINEELRIAMIKLPRGAIILHRLNDVSSRIRVVAVRHTGEFKEIIVE